MTIGVMVLGGVVASWLTVKFVHIRIWALGLLTACMFFVGASATAIGYVWLVEDLRSLYVAVGIVAGLVGAFVFDRWLLSRRRGKRWIRRIGAVLLFPVAMVAITTGFYFGVVALVGVAFALVLLCVAMWQAAQANPEQAAYVSLGLVIALLCARWVLHQSITPRWLRAVVAALALGISPLLGWFAWSLIGSGFDSEVWALSKLFSWAEDDEPTDRARVIRDAFDRLTPMAIPER